jgi:2-dehydro-3-deoxyphosphogluconate aldolase / (4S)-4-hydroxy-2-oxoglutarate aldolase
MDSVRCLHANLARVVEDIIAAGRLLPVVVLERAESAPPLADALLAGGVRCLEVTFRSEAAPDAIAAIGASHPAMLVGAGTVVTAAQVDQAVAAGARFVVSPGFGADVVDRCRVHGVPVFPGVATATEVQRALGAGVGTVKFFPAAQLGGPATIKALAAPFPTMRFIPTGGVTAETMPDYLAIPSVIAVGGTWLAPPDLIAAADWPEITHRTTTAIRSGGGVSGR